MNTSGTLSTVSPITRQQLLALTILDSIVNSTAEAFGLNEADFNTVMSMITYKRG